MLLNPLSHTERGVERHKGEVKAVIHLLEDLETELIKIKFKTTPILPSNTDVFLTLVKDASNTYKIQLKLREDLFIYDDAGIVKLSKCLTDSVKYWHLQPGLADITGAYTFFPNMDIAASYNSITIRPDVNVPVVVNWPQLFSKTDGTLLSTLMVL
jgi:hypothetical protein